MRTHSLPLAAFGVALLYSAHPSRLRVAGPAMVLVALAMVPVAVAMAPVAEWAVDSWG